MILARFVSSAVLAAVVLVAAVSSVDAASVRQGQQLAKLYCASCHAIDKVSPSPLTIAPPFRELHNRYPVETLEESLAEGIMTGHPTMPQFQFEPDQIADFLAFLHTLE
ncbi:MAG: cytochrome c [Xanthobacteraceae bacterium]